MAMSLLKTKAVCSAASVSLVVLLMGCVSDNPLVNDIVNSAVENSSFYKSYQATNPSSNRQQATSPRSAAASGITTVGTRLNSAQIRQLFFNKTVSTSLIGDPSKKQTLYFAVNYDLRMRAFSSINLKGSWSIGQDALCMNMNGGNGCQAVYYTPELETWVESQGSQQGGYYIAAPSGGPEMQILAIRNGNSEGL